MTRIGKRRRKTTLRIGSKSLDDREQRQCLPPYAAKRCANAPDSDAPPKTLPRPTFSGKEHPVLRHGYMTEALSRLPKKKGAFLRNASCRLTNPQIIVARLARKANVSSAKRIDEQFSRGSLVTSKAL